MITPDSKEFEDLKDYIDDKFNEIDSQFEEAHKKLLDLILELYFDNQNKPDTTIG